MGRTVFIVVLITTLMCYYSSATISAGKPGPTGRPIVIPDLRTSVIAGVSGRFLVNREDCINILKRKAPGLALELASDVKDVEYDNSLYSEIMITFDDIEDVTLSAEIGADLATAPVSTEGVLVAISLPVISSGEPIILMLAAYTDEKRPLMIPYYTNYQAVIGVDSITLESVTDDIAVATVVNGDDRLQLRIERSAGCGDDATVGGDFDNIIGEHIRITSYPRTFDWGCVDYSFGFCDALNADAGEPTEALIDGNVCTTMRTTKSVRCPIDVTLEGITGSFLGAGIPVPVGTVPVKSIEAEQINREHVTGIVFPCMKKREYRQMTLEEMWKIAKRARVM